MFLYRTKWGITLKNDVQENADNTAIALIKYNAKYNTSSWLLEPQSVIYTWFPSDITDKMRYCPALCSEELWVLWLKVVQDHPELLFALTGQGWSQKSPCHPGEQRQKPSAGLQDAPLLQEHVWLQFRPQLPLEHGIEQSTPCHPEEMGEKQQLGCFHGNCKTGSWQAAALCF